MDNNPINLNNPLGLDPPAEGEEMQVGEKNLTRTKVNGDDLTTEQKKVLRALFRVPQSPILVTTITLKRLEKKGYESLLDYYFKVAPLPKSRD